MNGTFVRERVINIEDRLSVGPPDTLSMSYHGNRCLKCEGDFSSPLYDLSANLGENSGYRIEDVFPHVSIENSDKWQLLVDCKEPNARDLCNTLGSYDLPANVENLSVGDYILVKNGMAYAIIERKDVRDLLASIIDGRYKDQASRMLRSRIPHQWFLIVGAIESLEGPDRSKINSAILHLQMQRNLKVICIPSKEHMKPLFVSMKRYLCQDPSTERIAAPLMEQIQADCKKRKLNEQSSVFKAQLACIQGVSESVANSISFEYRDFGTLLRCYAALDDIEEKETMLKDLQTTKKKLGPVLSKRIYHCIIGDLSNALTEKTRVKKVVKKIVRKTKRVKNTI